MPRPTNKNELLEASTTGYQKLWELIDTLSEEQKLGTFDFSSVKTGEEAHWTRDHNIRDLLVHLYEWQKLSINWVQQNRNGVPTPFIPEPYNWKNYGEMNQKFWEQHQDTSYSDAKNMLDQSQDEIMKLIETFSDEELFTKKYFSWTGTTSLGSYFVSATSSHFDWAMKKIKKYKKTLEK